MLGTIATQLTDRTTRYKRLTIGPTEVLVDYGSANLSVPMNTIRLSEEGPGGVSSMSFSVWDPDIQLIIAVGNHVEFWDVTNNRPLFLGFLSSFGIRMAGPHRWVDIECVGIEVLLDWMLVPALTIPTGTEWAAAIQSLVYNATGVGWPLRANSNPPGLYGSHGSQSITVPQTAPGFPTVQYDVVLDGDSLRDACNAVITACASWNNANGAMVSVDFYSGLRLYPAYVDTDGIMVLVSPDDCDPLEIELEGTTHASPSTINMEVDSGSIVRAVYVLGGNAAGTGLISDGSGIVGPTAYINDSTSTTATKRNAIGAAYLAQFSQSVRGTMTFTAIPAAFNTDNIRAGGSFVGVYPDAKLFGEVVIFILYSIRKTFYPGGEAWEVGFGGQIKSATKHLRRLTRSSRN